MLTDEQIEALAALYSLPYSKLSFARAIEAAATAPLLERIAELEELNSLNNQLINTQHRVMVNAEQRGVAKGLEECAEQIAELEATVRRHEVALLKAVEPLSKVAALEAQVEHLKATVEKEGE
jgi:hypothetical protein